MMLPPGRIELQNRFNTTTEVDYFKNLFLVDASAEAD